MTDIEPRRSGRKTKGQHTRNSEAHETIQTPVATKTASRRKSAKQPTPVASSPPISEPASEDEDDEDDDPNAQIRCACGATQELNGDSRMMVQCEGCKVWQHCECLELNEDDLEEEKDYYCEVCKPENHEEFLAKVERGEKPWETARKNRRKRKARRSTGRSRKRGAQARRKNTKKEEPEREPEPEPEPEPEEAPSQDVEPEAQVEEKPDIVMEQEESQEPQEGTQEEAQEEVQEEANDEPQEELQEGADVTKASKELGIEGTTTEDVAEEEMKKGKINGEGARTDKRDAGNSEQGEQSLKHENKGNEEDVAMSGLEDVNEVRSDRVAPTEKEPTVSMPPPDVPPVQQDVSQSSVKDEEMTDGHERQTPTPITPTTPTVPKQRESKRKGSMPEPQRALRRKTTHDSDGDYQSEGDGQSHQHSRRPSASSIGRQEPAKDVPIKPPARRPSMPKALPKKPSGPDDISIQSEAVEKVDDLRNNARRNIVNFLAPIVEKVVQLNEEILAEEQKHEDYPERLALEIEYHLYLALWNQHCQPTQAYKLKARGIGLNLPKNPVLQSRLLKGEVTPETLAQMKPEEMASEEFQLMAEQVRRESEIQNTIIAQEARPRIRRTHKGEEIIEDETSLSRNTGHDELAYSGGGGGGGADGGDHVMEEAPSPRSRAGSPTAEDYPMSPSHLRMEESAHPGSAPQTPRTPLSARTPTTARGRQFSIEGVWNNVNAPEGPTHSKAPGPRHQQQHMLSLRTTNQPKSEIDADIDKLLAEEDHDMENETPPYSPSELTFTDTALPVWRGRVSMISVSNFPARASFLGGAEDAQQKMPLNELLGGTMLIDGRIAIDRATEYLCGQKFSSTNEIIVLSIEPEDHIEPAAAGEFNKLFQYFQKKERYGVVGKPAHKAIKDCYLVPIDLRDDMPDFFETIAKHTLEPSPRKKRVFAIVFVLSKVVLAEEEKKRAMEAEKSKSNSETLGPMTRTPIQQQSQVPPHHLQQQPHKQQSYTGQPISDFPSQSHYSYQQPYAQRQHQYVTPPPMPMNHHGNGYNHSYYQQQQQQQQLPLHHQHSPTQQTPQYPPQQVPLPAATHQQPVKKFNFTPWKELQDALPELTIDQVNIINNIVAKNPAAQQDPVLLARLINEQGGM